MKETIIATIITAILFVVITAGLSYLFYNEGKLAKEYELAQTLCKYAEYDFCKVSEYKINIKKGK